MVDDNNKDKIYKFLKDNIGYILIIAIFFTILAPIIFTIGAKFKLLDFSNTGQIGDTIGGITSPIIGILAAFLVYISFKEQIRANEIQISARKEDNKDQDEQRTFELYLKFISDINNDINNLFYVYNHGLNNQETYNGSYAFGIFLDNTSLEGNSYTKFPILIEILFIYKNIEDLINEIDATEIRNNKILFQKIYRLFQAKLETNTWRFINLVKSQKMKDPAYEIKILDVVNKINQLPVIH
ncbi:MAG: hypothetical protein NT007_10615 [Candidatus Kapabacteria bacterium]|nr:hypothetical protein [Candidatus Kapabacteria bacterium]